MWCLHQQVRQVGHHHISAILGERGRVSRAVDTDHEPEPAAPTRSHASDRVLDGSALWLAVTSAVCTPAARSRRSRSSVSGNAAMPPESNASRNM